MLFFQKTELDGPKSEGFSLKKIDIESLPAELSSFVTKAPSRLRNKDQPPIVQVVDKFQAKRTEAPTKATSVQSPGTHFGDVPRKWLELYPPIELPNPVIRLDDNTPRSLTVAGFGFRTIGRPVNHFNHPLRSPTSSTNIHQFDRGGLYSFRTIGRLVSQPSNSINRPLQSTVHFNQPSTSINRPLQSSNSIISTSLAVAGSGFRTIGRKGAIIYWYDGEHVAATMIQRTNWTEERNDASHASSYLRRTAWTSPTSLSRVQPYHR
ncbi:hypothetical protein ACN42_g244 [Penicillium freii]|uniref:Uncharacterized protein n=1 Tax=Penicillium freii TaxID=48697 RepID=A0A117NSV3_PENFR|nr:hypothetical protein ACN42_g244 [Penicillium freii]